MGNRFGARALIAALLGVVAVAAIGFMSYNAGFAQGLAEAGRLAGTAGSAPSYVYMWPRPWGFGFGLFPFFVLLWLFALRGLFWRGRRGRGAGMTRAFRRASRSGIAGRTSRTRR